MTFHPKVSAFLVVAMLLVVAPQNNPAAFQQPGTIAVARGAIRRVHRQHQKPLPSHLQMSSTTTGDQQFCDEFGSTIEESANSQRHHDPFQNTNKLTRMNHSSLTKWTKRLVTKGDFLHIHKTSSIAYMLSCIAIVSYGLACLAIPSLDPVSPIHGSCMSAIFFVSTLVQSITAIPMAYAHRTSKLDLVVRSGFLFSSASQISAAVVACYAAPWWHGMVMDGLANALMISSAVLICKTSLECILRADDIIIGRQNPEEKKRMLRDGMSQQQRLMGLLQFVAAPVLLASPFAVLGVLFTMFVGHEGYLQLLELSPQLEVNLLYANVASVLASGVGTFTFTLKDRELIDKNTQIGLILTSVVPAVLYLFFAALNENVVGNMMDVVVQNLP